MGADVMLSVKTSVSVVAQQLFANSRNVAEFQPEEFEDRILKSSTKRVWLVDCYAHWCGHCKHFAPVWERVAKKFENDDRVRFGAINCAKHSSFCGKLGVKSYPSLRAYNFPSLIPKGAGELKGASIEKSPNDKKMIEIVQNLVNELPLVSTTQRVSDSVPSHSPEKMSIDFTTSALATSKDTDELKARSPEELSALRLIDAEVALVYSLHQGAFLAASEPSSPTTVPESTPHARPSILGEALHELVRWLEFLAAVFPSQKASSSLISLARYARQQMESQALLDRDEWLQLLRKQVIERVQPTAGEDPAPHFRLCGTYTCGLWTLFHIISMAVAETTRGIFLASVERSANIPQPAEVLARIRGFVAFFFGCETCVHHFLEIFDSCKFGRCRGSANNGQGVALWLWRVHNEVTKRVSKENGALVGPWPAQAACGTCRLVGSTSEVFGPEVDDDVRWDPVAVYAHLKQTFWQSGWTARGHSLVASSDVMWQLVILSLASVGLLYLTCLQVTGRCRRSKHGRKRC